MKPITCLLLLFFAIASCNLQPKKNTSQHNLDNLNEEKSIISIKTACIFSEISYCPDPEKELNQYLPGWKLVWDPVAQGGNYAFVATDGNVYALAIRGSLLKFSSDAFDNWIYNDLNVADQNNWSYADSTTHAKISAGSYLGWENLNKLTDKTTGKNLWDFLAANVGDAPLVLVGHSLGGNLATVYASYLWWKWKQDGHKKKNINVITFAAPAAGNAGFAENFDDEFPNSIRVENTNDIVPKFPVSQKISELGTLYSPAPAASATPVGYKNITVSLSKVFSMLSAAMDLLRITSDVSPYVQTNGQGDLITIPLSGKNTSNDATGWFAEAGYQHGMAQYAAHFEAPVIDCSSQ